MNPLSSKKLATTVAISSLFAVTASAALNLTINTVADTITISGTDSATIPEEFVFSGPPQGYLGTATWTLGVVGSGLFDSIDDDQNFYNAYVALNGTIIPELSDFNRMIVYDAGGVALQVRLDHPDSPLAEFGGSGISISYAGLISASNESFLASLDGQTLLPDESGGDAATGHSPISIQVVPEPATYGLLLGVGMILATFLRRRS